MSWRPVRPNIFYYITAAFRPAPNLRRSLPPRPEPALEIDLFPDESSRHRVVTDSEAISQLLLLPFRLQMALNNVIGLFFMVAHFFLVGKATKNAWLFKTDGTPLSDAVLELVNLNAALVRHHPELQLARENCSKVVLGLSSMVYKDAFVNWYQMSGQPSGCALIVTWDASTCEYLAESQMPSICMEEPASLLNVYASLPDIKSLLSVALAKLIFPWAFLLHGRSVLLTEMDVFWAKDCFLDLDRPENKVYDMQVANHIDLDMPGFRDSKGEINIGFFYVRPTMAARVVFSQMLSYGISHALALGSHRTMDQKLFDRFIRLYYVAMGDEPPQWSHRFTDFADFVAASNSTPAWKEFRWRRLPVFFYPHNIGSKLQFHNSTNLVHIRCVTCA